MRDWKILTLALCSVGFFKEMRPSEPFLTPYLKEPPMNFTEEEVDNQIYPVWTYSYLVGLFLAFLLTDALLYKPVIVFGSANYIITWVILIWGRGVTTMQFMQFTYGLCTASEIAYYSYLYAVVDKDHYQKVSGFSRMSILSGSFTSHVMAQLLISLSVTDYLSLNYVSLSFVSLAFILALALPRASYRISSVLQRTVEQEMRFHVEYDRSADTVTFDEGCNTDLSDPSAIKASSDQRVGFIPITFIDIGSSEQRDPESSDYPQSNENPTTHLKHQSGSSPEKCSSNSSSGFVPITYEGNDNNPSQQSKAGSLDQVELDGSQSACSVPRWKFLYDWGDYWKSYFRMMWGEFLQIYSNKYLLIWSVWWAIASCGDFEVGNYIQNLWDAVSPKRDARHTYNAGVGAVSTLLGALSALSVGYLKVNWRLYGELLLAVMSMGSFVLLTIMAHTENIWVAYTFYVIFRTSYQLVITVASFQIASQLTAQKYGLVFGFNMFLALALDTIITVILVDKRGLNAPVRTQFTVYGSYFGIMGLIFIAKTVYNFVHSDENPFECCTQMIGVMWRRLRL